MILPGPREVAAALGEVDVAVLLENKKVDEGRLVATGAMLASSRYDEEIGALHNPKAGWQTFAAQ